uniref:Uncharacterized protein n=1 Tax=Caenorhabditis tropicalis TaxID=1561998 RepID=A0A1I7V4Y7_9PELO
MDQTTTSKEDQNEHPEEDVDEDLTNPNLYEESMAEITLNETKNDVNAGHDSDPFDRSGEYDEEVNLDAPPPITPDIPEISTDVLISLRNRATSSEASSDVRNPFSDSEDERKNGNSK